VQKIIIMNSKTIRNQLCTVASATLASKHFRSAVGPLHEKAAGAAAATMAPEELSTEGAASLMCAGVTTFNCFRKSGVWPGNVVTVASLGGLGHLAIQRAVKSGFNMIDFHPDKHKQALARKLGTLGGTR
jgi:D-arabinose 1-dehydrogenase-like Zn-dependent alcohol dehydrogenase